MATTESLNQKQTNPSTLFCPIRKRWILKQPEEMIRQQWLKRMTEELLFPLSCLSVETSLSRLPHLTAPPPSRRTDILCFGKDIHPDFPLFPLLVLECKASPLSPQALRQLIGYNHHIRAYFIALANQKQIQTGWYDPKQKTYQFVNYLPNYQQLLKSCSYYK